MEKQNEWGLIIEFITKLWPFFSNEKLNRNTKLQEDLGIGGDDADELIYEFSNLFNINIENFSINKYFMGYKESSLFIKKDVQKIEELTLGDLENALKSGKLDDNLIMKKGG